eukprot:472662-Ditylum_brightwellii.AAC.1
MLRTGGGRVWGSVWEGMRGKLWRSYLDTMAELEAQSTRFGILSSISIALDYFLQINSGRNATRVWWGMLRRGFCPDFLPRFCFAPALLPLLLL